MGIIVKDLDASISFYHDILGLEFATEPSGWITGIKGARLRHVCLRLADTMLELLEFDGAKDKTKPLYATGAPHLAFQVDSVTESKTALEAKGVSFLSDVNLVDEGILAGWRWAYFSDPDGYPIELVEVAYNSEEERRKGIASFLLSKGYPSLTDVDDASPA